MAIFMKEFEEITKAKAPFSPRIYLYYAHRHLTFYIIYFIPMSLPRKNIYFIVRQICNVRFL